ncbi:hypothetical protein ACFQZ4_05855 [Catellatospora coxensis]
MRVLVVDDEELMAGAIAEGLRQESFAVDVAHDGAQVPAELATGSHDVLILGLPRRTATSSAAGSSRPGPAYGC